MQHSVTSPFIVATGIWKLVVVHCDIIRHGLFHAASPISEMGSLYTMHELCLLKCTGDASDVRRCGKLVSDRNTTFLMRRFWTEDASKEPVLRDNVQLDDSSKRQKKPLPFLDLATLSFEKPLRSPSHEHIMVMASRCIGLLETRKGPMFSVRLYNQKLLASKTVNLETHCKHVHAWEFVGLATYKLPRDVTTLLHNSTRRCASPPVLRSLKNGIFKSSFQQSA